MGDTKSDTAAINLGMRLYDAYDKGRSLTFADFQRELDRYMPHLARGLRDTNRIAPENANDWPYYPGYFDPTFDGVLRNAQRWFS